MESQGHADFRDLGGCVGKTQALDHLGRFGTNDYWIAYSNLGFWSFGKGKKIDHIRSLPVDAESIVLRQFIDRIRHSDRMSILVDFRLCLCGLRDFLFCDHPGRKEEN
jgi:hypothetical protein